MSKEENAKLEFEKKLHGVIQTLKERASKEDAEGIIFDLKNLQRANPDEFVKTVYEMSDASQIQQERQSDPTFSSASAGVRAMGNSAFFGAPDYIQGAIEGTVSGKGVSQGIAERQEKSRLLAKDNPKANAIGTAVGLVGLAKAPAAAVMGVGAKGFVQGAKLLGPNVAKLLDQSFIARTALEGAGAFGAYEGAKTGTESAVDVALGQKSVGDAIYDTGKATLGGLKTGLVVGGVGGAVATGSIKTAQALSSTSQKGFQYVAKNFFGKDIKYAIENTEVVQNAMKAGPEAVIAQSAEKIAPVVQQVQGQMRAIQVEAKQQILRDVGQRRIQLEGSLKDTANLLNESVNRLRNAAEGDIVGAAKQLHKQVDASYAAANAEFGRATEFLKDSPALTNMAPALDQVEALLKQNRAIDARGTLLSGSQFAKTEPELFAKLEDLWSRMGGPVRAQGGKSALNVNINDALLLKREIGELANFSGKANRFEGAMRSVYNRVRQQLEVAEPKLKEINATFANNRSKIDEIRTNLGKSEQQVATRLRRDLGNNKNLFLLEAMEGFGGLGGKEVAATQTAMTASEKLQALIKFKDNPRQMFKQIQDAYVREDSVIMSGLENLVAKNPQLAPYVRAAKNQATLLKQVPKNADVTRAFQNPGSLEELSKTFPQARANAQAAAKAQIQSQELQRVLPDNRLALEQQLGRSDFGASPIEQQVISQAAKADPAVSGALKNAEAARVAGRLQSGEGMKPTALEEIPIIGKTIFSLRKAATPSAARFLTFVGKSQPKVRRAMLEGVLDSLSGTQAIPKAAILKLRKEVGPEAAVAIYYQNGGEQDLAAALDQAARDSGME